jgi:uncharacterized coiled-coil protein SlyX
MKNLITILLLIISLSSFSQTRYPIKTIFKGDSVIILTIQQSENINKMIEKNSRAIKENNAKVQEYTNKIKLLEQVIAKQNVYIDSLSNNLLECRNGIDTIQYNSDTLLKQYDELNLTIYEMAVGPTLLYTLPPYNEVLFLNLKHFNMYTDSEGALILERMNPAQMKKYDGWREKYGNESLMHIDYQKVIKFRDFQDELLERIIWKNKFNYSK